MNTEQVKTKLMEIALGWWSEADIHDANGDADCGTGSDVPYAQARACREHAKQLEDIINAMP